MLQDSEILKEMQKIQPWLVRVCIPDENFARILSHITFAVIENNEQLRSDKFDDMLVLVVNGKKLHINPNKGAIAPIVGYIILWLRYVCLKNKTLYRNTLAVCFNKDTILHSDFERREYIEGRLLGLGIPDSQLDDIYFILKGYIDTVYKIGILGRFIASKYMGKQNDFLMEMKEKYDKTEDITKMLDVNQIAEVLMRDMFSGINLDITNG